MSFSADPRSDTAPGAGADAASPPEPSSPPPPRRRPLRALLWRSALAVGVCAALLWGLMPAGSLEAVGTALADARPGPVLAALALYPLMAVTRAWRLRVALGPTATGTPPVGALVRVAAVHSLLASFAPMRLGELSLVWLLHRAARTPLVTGSALLVLLRMMDLIVVLAAGLLALTALPAARVVVPDALPIAAALVAGLVAGVLLGPWLVRRLPVPDVATTGDGRRLARLGRLWRSLHDTLAGWTAPHLLSLLTWSLPVWAVVFAMAWLCANATGAAVGLAGGVAGGSATALAMVLPVNTIANVGTFEAAWVLALRPAGLDDAAALATGLLFHGVTLLGSALVGGVALAAGGRRLLSGGTAGATPPGAPPPR